MSDSVTPLTVAHPSFLSMEFSRQEVGSHSLLQGIFSTQGSNPGLLYCRQVLYSLSHQGSRLDIYWKLKQRKPKQNPHILNECVLTMLWLSAWNHLWRFSHGRTSLVAQKVKHLPTVRGTQVQSLGQEDLLKKEMATHSSILAWKISWTEVPDEL